MQGRCALSNVEQRSTDLRQTPARRVLIFPGDSVKCQGMFVCDRRSVMKSVH